MIPFPSINEINLANGQPSTTHARSARAVAAGSGLSDIHIPPQRSVATVELFAGAGFMRVSLEASDLLTPKPEPPKRGEIDHFSDASRRRMMDYLAKVDYSQVPFWLDLTYPDIFPEDNERWKRDWEIFVKRLVRRWPEASGFWKLEFKPRLSGVNKGKLAPHYHALVFNVPWSFPFQPERAKNYRLVFTTGHDWETGEAREECITQVLVDGVHVTDKWGLQDDFRHWAARNWYEVVNSQDERHFKAGTSVSHLRTRQGGFRYASKRYVAKKEEVKLLNLKPGRFWGVFNRKHLPLGQRQSYRLTQKQAVQLRRFIRRYRRANTPPKQRRWLRKGSASNAAKGFSVKLYCKADFWIERLPRLLGPLPEPYVAKPANAFQRQFL
jgi:hypothetical protein